MLTRKQRQFFLTNPAPAENPGYFGGWDLHCPYCGNVGKMQVVSVTMKETKEVIKTDTWLSQAKVATRFSHRDLVWRPDKREPWDSLILLDDGSTCDEQVQCCRNICRHTFPLQEVVFPEVTFPED